MEEEISSDEELNRRVEALWVKKAIPILTWLMILYPALGCHYVSSEVQVLQQIESSDRHRARIDSRTGSSMRPIVTDEDYRYWDWIERSKLEYNDEPTAAHFWCNCWYGR